MHSNNDLMEPNWKPELGKKNPTISNLEELIYWSEHIVHLFKDRTDQELSDSRYSVQINGHVILYLKNALNGLRGGKSQTKGDGDE